MQVLRRLAPGARLGLARCGLGASSPRLLCTTKPWDAASQVHGAPKSEVISELSDEGESSEGTTRQKQARQRASARREGGAGQRTSFLGAAAGSNPGYSRLASGGLSTADRADLLQFQVYVRQRLGELQARLPPKMSTRERAELAFLEETVVREQLPSARKRIRDPLRDVDEREIRHTNLNLLSRFVSEAGSILPKRLTGVVPRKQRKLTKAIKRAQQLALMPKTWKLPRYRHASYTDQYSMPERPPPQRSEDDEFRDAPDIRFPNQWEDTRNPLDLDLARLVRAAQGTSPRPPASSPGGSSDTWPTK